MPHQTKMPTTYNPPFGTPFYWRNEMSGLLAQAISIYVNYAAGEITLEPTEDQIQLVRDYFEYVINAPCWHDEGGELERLKETLKHANSVGALNLWLDDCLKIAIDPL
ncbi:hypothetical protein IQ268_30615 [Oculatella sp. LEGE 06141]|uniref:hypothetical protein n=1 Tax=Oculatella sp. LEGE 06141 TaxID=1828648 RepID=UPI0018801D3F|nr:hypothetical protein [Oculatella sp. LEGE 06141]MBE9182892.1 hypothetical protein [Oculatella sp. LEGE 06141]